MRTRLLALLSAIMVALVCMSAPASADEVGEITSQVSHHEIHPDGSMTMTQTSTWRFSGNLESMFFTVPLGEKGVNELSNVSIVAPDGRQPKANFEEETDPNGRGVRRYTIHAKDFPLKSGPWKLQYTLSNTLVEDGDFSVLAFNIISPVNPTVGRWEATINSPWTISGVQCTIDQQEKCQVKRSEKSVTFSGGEAKPGTDVFLIVGYPISETGHVGRPQQPGGSTPETPSAPATPSDSTSPSGEEEPTGSPSTEASDGSGEPSAEESASQAGDDTSKEDSDDDAEAGASAGTGLIIALSVAGLLVVAVIVWLLLRQRGSRGKQESVQQWQGHHPQQGQYPPQQGQYPRQQYPQQGPGQQPPSQWPNQPPQGPPPGH